MTVTQSHQESHALMLDCALLDKTENNAKLAKAVGRKILSCILLWMEEEELSYKGRPSGTVVL